MGEVIDTDFINPIETRPKLSKIEDDAIPIIDLSPIAYLDHVPVSVRDQKIDNLVAEIGSACEKWGFFQVVNHGVPFETVKNLENAAVKFFGQSKDEKRKVNHCGMNPMGYSDDEHTGHVKDWKQGFEFAVNEDALGLVLPHHLNSFQIRNRWPQYPPQLRDVAQDYATEMSKMVNKLLELIELSLGVRANRLTEFYKDPALFMRLSLYMACPNPDLVLGIGAHKDSAGLTVISEDDVGGLQVRRKSDGEWISVKAVSGAFIVNIGDTLQVWSNDKYESVEHRVILNPEKSRLSIASSFGPGFYVNVKPLEELVDEGNPARYKEFNFGTFRASILKGNITKPNNPQKIVHFRLCNN
ncbi:protein LATERAL BRANCHING OXIDOREDUCTASE 1-like [Silene latifolia]|uniref:protein LATERAL BRANCHING OXIDOREDUCTASE 1-like n=1 Tax=Silene latifolia TaxID=37657 RepID=UPI003D78202D